MFYDWLTMYQDHDTGGEPLPFLGDRGAFHFDVESGDVVATTQPAHKHPGSYCTSIQVSISGSRVKVSGNPSRYNRIDNLFGFNTLDECVAVYNQILLSLGLPPFSKCTRVWQLQGEEGSRVQTVSDGAIITEVHITSNRAVGENNELDYLKALSTQKVRNSEPRLLSNGNTVDWLSKKGKAPLIYPSVYCKANEIELHLQEKIARAYGTESEEYKYLQFVIDYCRSAGVVRFEQKIKSAFLRRNDLRFYGLFDEVKFKPIHDEFLALDDRLQVTAMTVENIAERLIREDIVSSTHAANVTSMYAIQWMHGATFDLKKAQVKVHRARLRQIGIDIGLKCDTSRHSPVFVRKVKEIEVSGLDVPSWYQRPGCKPNLKLVA